MPSSLEMNEFKYLDSELKQCISLVPTAFFASVFTFRLINNAKVIKRHYGEERERERRIQRYMGEREREEISSCLSMVFLKTFSIKLFHKSSLFASCTFVL